ncbi:hypothetical protein Henu3_gp52 [Mycobacterium phage Henu3 PeY-2017]|nr:hypothetical protein Henu3_gp52 [Mycobacterium phage Henu3 PeY-2017]
MPRQLPIQRFHTGVVLERQRRSVPVADRLPPAHALLLQLGRCRGARTEEHVRHVPLNGEDDRLHRIRSLQQTNVVLELQIDDAGDVVRCSRFPLAGVHVLHAFHLSRQRRCEQVAVIEGVTGGRELSLQ